VSSIIKRRVALFGLLVALGATERNAEAGAYWGLTGGPVTRSAAPRFAPALSEANTTITSQYAAGGSHRMNFGLPQAGWDSTLDSLILIGIIFGSSGGPSGR